MCCKYNLFIVFVSSCVLVSAVNIHGSLEKYGPFELVLYSHLLKCNHDKNLNLDVSDIGVLFHDFNKNTEVTYPIGLAAQSIISIQNIDFNRPWVIFVPGFNSPMTGTSNGIMKDAIKNLENTYYIVIDHNVYTSVGDSYKKSYEKSVEYVFDISKAVADFLSSLYRSGIPMNAVRCIGHSLGSQILGQTGFLFAEATGFPLKRITALDPAGPCFSNSLIENQVRSGAAEYVEIYHCNAGAYGTASVLGDVDFFANDRGEWQPHCHVPIIPGVHDSAEAAKCSHQACIKLFAATVYHSDWFPARKCDSYRMFKHGVCSDDGLAGFWNPGSSFGVFYFSTKEFDL